MIQPRGIGLPNKHRVVFVVASGGLGYDGLGWWWERLLRCLGLIDPSLFTVFAKTFTFLPRKGNFQWWRPWGCLRFLPNWWNCEGILNAFGLGNPGFDWWLRNVGLKADSEKLRLVASVYPENPDELRTMIWGLNRCDIVAIELNVSCPTADDDLLSNVQRIIEYCQVADAESFHPVILKLSVAHFDQLAAILSLVRGLVDAVSINSVPWPYPDVVSPLVKLGGGGLSGKRAQNWTWSMARRIQALCPTMPVIWPSMWYFRDIAEAISQGAPAVSFGGLGLRHPTWPTRFVREFIQQSS